MQKRKHPELAPVESAHIPQDDIEGWKKTLKGLGFSKDEIETILFSSKIEKGAENIEGYLSSLGVPPMTPEQKEGLRQILLEQHKRASEK